MRLRRKIERSNVVIVAATFARLVDVVRDVNMTTISYTYEITYDIDDVAAHRAAAHSVNVAVKQHASVVESMWTDVRARMMSMDNVVDSILMFPQRVRTTRLSQVNEQLGVTKLISDREQRRVRSVVARPMSAVRSSNIEDTPALTLVSDDVNVEVSTNDVQQASFDAIFKQRVDPADVFMSLKKSRSTTASTMQGTSASTVDGARSAASSQKVRTRFDALFRTTRQRYDELADDVLVPVIERRVLNSQHVVVLSIPAADVQTRSTLDIVFTAYNESGDVVDRQEHIIKHEKLLAAFMVPREPPGVSVSTSIPGKNVIDIVQRDDRAIGVMIYKRTITSATDVVDPRSVSYVHIGDVAVTRRDGSVKVVDPVSTLGTTMYRFISYGENGRVSSSFSSFVTRSTDVTKVPRRKTNVKCVIDIEGREDGCTIRLVNIVKGPIAVVLQRRNMTIHDVEYAYVAAPVLITGTEDITFDDREVKRGNIYDYRVVFIFDDGSQVVSHVHQLYEHVHVYQRDVQITTSNPQVKRITQPQRHTSLRSFAPVTFDVTFSIESNFRTLDDDMLRSALQARGLSTEYADEFVAARDKLTDIVAHHVMRYNLQTGDVDDLGITTSKVFSDLAASRVNATRPVTPGTKYKYVLTTLLRSPESMFETFEKSVMSSGKFAVQTTGSLAATGYTYRPAKFRHPLALRAGIMSSVSSRRDRHGSNEFMYGSIGNNKTVEITIPHDSAALSDVSVERLDPSTNIVRWTLQGDPTSIDYFIIVLSRNHDDLVVGKVHALSNSTTFEFEHDITDVEVGTATYTIRAMLTNFAMGPSVTSEQVIF